MAVQPTSRGCLPFYIDATHIGPPVQPPLFTTPASDRCEQQHDFTMLAARADQENAVHAQQTAAAAKPLNQGLKGFTAKTPGNRAPKTPYKVPLNDENATYQFGKSALKTNAKGQENGLTVGKAGGKVDKSAFVTPAGWSTTVAWNCHPHV